MSDPAVAAHAGWRAHLRLTLRARGGRTILAGTKVRWWCSGLFIRKARSVTSIWYIRQAVSQAATD